MAKNELYEYLKNSLGFASKEIERAFAQISRVDFVPKEFVKDAYADFPLPISKEATISQPTTVAFMLNLLDPRPGEKILDIGAGSGWTTALLANIVGEKGKVVGTEIIKELVKFGNKNIKKYKLNAKIVLAGKKLGLPTQAPFDKILVSAAAQKLPVELISQLKVGARLVLPILNSIWKIDKVSETEIDQEEFPGFVFVPLLWRKT